MPVERFKKLKDVDPKVIRRKYWREKKSMKDLANEYKCSSNLILQFMKYHNIPRKIPQWNKEVFRDSW